MLLAPHLEVEGVPTSFGTIRTLSRDSIYEWHQPSPKPSPKSFGTIKTLSRDSIYNYCQTDARSISNAPASTNATAVTPLSEETEDASLPTEPDDSHEFDEPWMKACMKGIPAQPVLVPQFVNPTWDPRAMVTAGARKEDVLSWVRKQMELCQAFLDDEPGSTEEAQAEVPASSFAPPLAEISSSRDNCQQTTCMLKNLPNDLTRDQLVQLLNSQGLKGEYDILYAPYDFRNDRLLGYMFVNMRTHDGAVNLWDCFQGFTWQHSRKVCSVAWADKTKGCRALIDKYRNNSVNHNDVQERFKPVLFDENGESLGFPPPTKHVKKPKLKFRGAETPARAGDEGEEEEASGSSSGY